MAHKNTLYKLVLVESLQAFLYASLANTYDSGVKMLYTGKGRGPVLVNNQQTPPPHKEPFPHFNPNS